VDAIDGLTGWDWFVGGVFLVSVGFGLLRGLVRTVFALAAWIVALVGMPIAGWHVLARLGEQVPAWVVYGGSFLALFVLVRLAGGLLARGLRGVGLGGADRFLGGVLGLARAALVVLLAAAGAHLAGLSDEPAWQQARSRPLLEAMVEWVQPWLPEDQSGIRRT
jgi:membrane protein required for colicin V production